MPVPPELYPFVALRHVQSPELIPLFQDLCSRAEALAALETDLSETILRNREARDGKPLQYTRRQREFLEEADADAVKARSDMERYALQMDDAGFLVNAIMNERQMIQMKEYLSRGWSDGDVREKGTATVEFRKETLRILLEFLEASPLRDQVVPLLSVLDPKLEVSLR